MKAVDVITIILLVIGGLNWGLVGVFRFDLVAWIFGDMALISRIVYIIVGVCALYQIVLWKPIHVRWAKPAPAK